MIQACSRSDSGSVVSIAAIITVRIIALLVVVLNLQRSQRVAHGGR
jgi:hypothetical protein